MDGLFSLAFNPALMNTRRFVSTIEANGLLNVAVNLESVEHNLRNSLIKSTSDRYRRNNKVTKAAEDQVKQCQLCPLFVPYLAYVLSPSSLFNPLLLLLNMSFFFSAIGFYVLVVYFGEFCKKQSIPRNEAIYVFFLLILVQGFGRVFSTLMFKCNESTVKGRVYTYNLSLVCLGIATMSSTFLCDTVFSLTMFAIVFGSLYGELRLEKPLRFGVRQSWSRF